MTSAPVHQLKSGWWPRLFQPLHPDERYVKLRRRPRPPPPVAPVARHISWRRRSYAYSAASAATAVAPLPPAAVEKKEPEEAVETAQQQPTMEAFPELILTPEVPMLHQLSESDYSIASSFWRTYDRRISTGGASMVGVRTIIDAMVDDVVTTGAATGWRVDVGSGTFNDVLGSANSLHPIVTAFARAHVEGAHVILAPEHVWLAVLQGVAAVIRHTGTTSKRDQRFDSSDSPDLDDVWRVLRESSDVPMTCLASSGHE
ncbi:hypothetical protein IWW38_003305, partial [Coemansia aciculifera]